jgi:Activator of Hsp90 ATPase homolog 1-like protein
MTGLVFAAPASHLRSSSSQPEDDPRRTYVEFTLEPVGAGTRLTVVETGFAQLPEDAHHKAYDGNTQGWASWPAT